MCWFINKKYVLCDTLHFITLNVIRTYNLNNLLTGRKYTHIKPGATTAAKGHLLLTVYCGYHLPNMVILVLGSQEPGATFLWATMGLVLLGHATSGLHRSQERSSRGSFALAVR